MSLNLRPISDLHLEFGPLDLPVMEGESEQILLLMGDIGLASKTYTFYPFLEEMSDRFRNVLMIMGNHEHYRGSFVRSYAKIEEATVNLENFYLLEDEVIKIDGVAFIGSALWTNFHNLDVVCMQTAQLQMNDYALIRTGTKTDPYKRKLNPNDIVAVNQKSKKFIFDTIKEQKEKGNKVVVMTHHGPSFLSVPEQFRGQTLNGAYVSEYFEDIYEHEPSFWFHGHTHISFDYEINKTRVIVNPRGYTPDDLNPEFDPCLVLTV